MKWCLLWCWTHQSGGEIPEQQHQRDMVSSCGYQHVFPSVSWLRCSHPGEQAASWLEGNGFVCVIKHKTWSEQEEINSMKSRPSPGIWGNLSIDSYFSWDTQLLSPVVSPFPSTQPKQTKQKAFGTKQNQMRCGSHRAALFLVAEQHSFRCCKARAVWLSATCLTTRNKAALQCSDW